MNESTTHRGLCYCAVLQLGVHNFSLLTPFYSLLSKFTKCDFGYTCIWSENNKFFSLYLLMFRQNRKLYSCRRKLHSLALWCKFIFHTVEFLHPQLNFQRAWKHPFPQWFSPSWQHPVSSEKTQIYVHQGWTNWFQVFQIHVADASESQSLCYWWY